MAISADLTLTNDPSTGLKQSLFVHGGLLSYSFERQEESSYFREQPALDCGALISQVTQLQQINATLDPLRSQLQVFYHAADTITERHLEICSPQQFSAIQESLGRLFYVMKQAKANRDKAGGQIISTPARETREGGKKKNDVKFGFVEVREFQRQGGGGGAVPHDGGPTLGLGWGLVKNHHTDVDAFERQKEERKMSAQQFSSIPFDQRVSILRQAGTPDHTLQSESEDNSRVLHLRHETNREDPNTP
eukprot:CAMPEP_0201503896 /NCGR_PEP_ID=MMETSP0151_2-20130828/84915_1 /ASSEMBLY_ACC=CAM_ASM_000257 /TAXON_ID=200890 /ORGANISM="Paramoeba atlantica, Strain 621/1 / CCAP 1560/9" /LENGTH=248 /DNA_ID=CAMNT_0047897595 /DNA_START=468 /DNA_END=1215 /DNA_ORIENTATION=+